MFGDDDLRAEEACQSCGGNGFYVKSVAVCCGWATPEGECCGNPVEDQEQVACEYCGGTGRAQ